MITAIDIQGETIDFGFPLDICVAELLLGEIHYKRSMMSLLNCNSCFDTFALVEKL